MTRLFAAPVLLVALLSTACITGTTPSGELVRHHFEDTLPGSEFRHDTGVHLGRITFGLAKGAMRLTAFEDRETRRAISHIKRVSVATYEVLSLPETEGVTLPRRFQKSLEQDGWYPMLREREEDSHTWIFYREDKKSVIRNLYIVTLDEYELTVIDLAGKLNRMMAELVADDPDGFLEDIGA